jgi:hypothetical protein
MAVLAPHAYKNLSDPIATAESRAASTTGKSEAMIDPPPVLAAATPTENLYVDDLPSGLLILNCARFLPELDGVYVMFATVWA